MTKQRLRRWPICTKLKQPPWQPSPQPVNSMSSTVKKRLRCCPSNSCTRASLNSNLNPNGPVQTQPLSLRHHRPITANFCCECLPAPTSPARRHGCVNTTTKSSLKQRSSRLLAWHETVPETQGSSLQFTGTPTGWSFRAVLRLAIRTLMRVLWPLRQSMKRSATLFVWAWTWTRWRVWTTSVGPTPSSLQKHRTADLSWRNWYVQIENWNGFAEPTVCPVSVERIP